MGADTATRHEELLVADQTKPKSAITLYSIVVKERAWRVRKDQILVTLLVLLSLGLSCVEAIVILSTSSPLPARIAASAALIGQNQLLMRHVLGHRKSN